MLFGSTLPVALAPFTSLTGDAFELGSIVVTWFPPWSVAGVRAALRGDDVFRAIPRVQDFAAGPVPWLGLFLAVLLGVVWALATHALGARVARACGRGPVLAQNGR
jgi:hypothetical protein